MGRQGCQVTTHIVKRDHIHQTVTLVFSPGSQRNKASLCQVEIALVSVSVCEAGGLKSIYFVWKAQTACCQAEEQAGGSLLINYYWKAHSQHLRCEIMPSAFLGLWFTLWQLSVSEFFASCGEVKLVLKLLWQQCFSNKDLMHSWKVEAMQGMLSQYLSHVFKTICIKNAVYINWKR